MFMPNVAPSDNRSGVSNASRTVSLPLMSLCRRGSATRSQICSGGAGTTRSTVSTHRLMARRYRSVSTATAGVLAPSSTGDSDAWDGSVEGAGRPTTEEIPMLTRTSMTVAGAVASTLLLGGIAFAAVQTVDSSPQPQVVIPSSATHSPQSHGGADDPATHDVNDDSTGRSGGGHGADDPATHDVNDDSTGRSGGGHGADDPATHDVNDDSTGRSGGGHGADDPATHDANDDSTGRSGGGHGADDPATHDANDDSSGSGSGSGADDPVTHDATDDSTGSGSGSTGSDDSGSGSGGSSGGSDDSGSGHGGHGADG